MSDIKLKYIGNGKQLPGIPARDLNEVDFPAITKRYGWSPANIPALLTGNKNSLYEWTLEDMIAYQPIEITVPMWKRIWKSFRNKILRLGT